MESCGRDDEPRLDSHSGLGVPVFLPRYREILACWARQLAGFDTDRNRSFDLSLDWPLRAVIESAQSRSDSVGSNPGCNLDICAGLS